MAILTNINGHVETACSCCVEAYRQDPFPNLVAMVDKVSADEYCTSRVTTTSVVCTMTLFAAWWSTFTTSAAGMMQKRDFPQNLERQLGVRPDGSKGVQRKAVVLRLVMQQILAALRSCHDTGALPLHHKSHHSSSSELEASTCPKLVWN